MNIIRLAWILFNLSDISKYVGKIFYQVSFYLLSSVLSKFCLITLATPLASRGSVFEEWKNPPKDLNLKIKSKIILGPILSFSKIENWIGSDVIEILSLRQIDLTY